MDLVRIDFTLRAGQGASAERVVLVVNILRDFTSVQRNWELSGSCSKMCSRSLTLSHSVSFSLSTHTHTADVDTYPLSHILLYSFTKNQTPFNWFFTSHLPQKSFFLSPPQNIWINATRVTVTITALTLLKKKSPQHWCTSFCIHPLQPSKTDWEAVKHRYFQLYWTVVVCLI